MGWGIVTLADINQNEYENVQSEEIGTFTTNGDTSTAQKKGTRIPPCKDSKTFFGDFDAQEIIRDAFDQSLENVEVEIDNCTVVTDGIGSWKISGLYVNVTTEPRVAKQGENVTYILTVTNKGKETATGILLHDILPVGTDLVDFHAQAGVHCDIDSVTCTLPNLALDATATVELIITIPQAEKLQNTAKVMANEYPDNEQVTWTKVISYLSVSVTDTPNPVSLLSKVHYTLEVKLRHDAPSSATGVELAMNLPSGVKLESLNTDAGICDLSQLPRVICSLIDLTVGANALSHATIDMDVTLEDAGLLLLTLEANVTANEYPTYLARKHTKIFIPDDIEVDIALVIDVTGSMQYEINSIIKALKQFIAELEPNEARLIALIVFTDDVKVKAFTQDLNVLLSAVENLKIHGGGTCPEASAEALQIAIPHTKADGTILFSSDASPYENADIASVAEMLRKKGIRFNAILTGDCSQQNSQNEWSD
jgi:uncharacterized repeat protein (TIGR01451 family)